MRFGSHLAGHGAAVNFEGLRPVQEQEGIVALETPDRVTESAFNHIKCLTHRHFLRWDCGTIADEVHRISRRRLVFYRKLLEEYPIDITGDHRLTQRSG